MLMKPAMHTYANAQIQKYLGKGKTQRRQYVGASEIGLCARRIFFAKEYMRHPIDTKHSDSENWGASRRGVTFERHFWLPAMRARYGDNLLYAGPQQRSMKYGTLRATPDGLLINQPRDALKAFGIKDIGPSGEIAVECKTIDPRIPLQIAKPEHEFQTQVQLGLFHKTTDHRPLYAVISYTNASFFDDVTEFVFKYDPEILDGAMKRAGHILSAKDAGSVRAEGWIEGGKECEWCPFKQPCDAIRLPRGELVRVPVSKLDTRSSTELERLGVAERKVAASISSLEKDHRNLQEEIKEKLRSLDLRAFDEGGSIKIIWSPVKGRPSYNMPELREAAAKLGLNIQKYETVGQPTDRLMVTLKTLRSPRD